MYIESGWRAVTVREVIWRVLLCEPHREWTQQDLAASLGVSKSTVYAALRVPRRVGAVQVGYRHLRVADWEKLRTIWATFRNLEADTLLTLRLRASVREVEGDMIPGARFTGPTAAKLALGGAPADYDQVMVYVDPSDLPALQERYAGRVHRRGQTVLRAIRPDRWLPPRVPLVQVYVDLWQLPDWWATDFLRYVGPASEPVEATAHA